MTFFNTYLPNDGKVKKISLTDLSEKNVHEEIKAKFFDYYRNNVVALDFSGYDKLSEKFKVLFLKSKDSLNIKNVNEFKFESFNLNKKVKIQRDKKERTSKSETILANTQKKRSALIAEISVIYEENESDSNKNDSNKPKDSQTTNIVQKTLKKLQRKDNFEESDDLNQAYIQTISTTDVNQPSKKFRSSDINEINRNEEIKSSKLKKNNQSRKSKKSKKSKLSSLGKSLKNDETIIEDKKYVFNVTDAALLDIKKAINANTPQGQTPFKPKLAKVNNDKTCAKETNKTQIINKQTPFKKFQDASKSEKKILVKPIIDLQSKPSNQNDFIKTIKPATKVKKIVETIENKMNKIAANLKFLPFSTNQKKSPKVVKSIIDNRKKKTSMSKPEIKRKSMKQIDAFLKDLAQDHKYQALTNGKKINEPLSFNTVVLNPKLNNNLNKSIHNAKNLLNTPGIKESVSVKKKLDVNKLPKESAEKSLIKKQTDRLIKTQPKSNAHVTPIIKKLDLNETSKGIITNTLIKTNKNKVNEQQQITYECLKYDQGKLNHFQAYEEEYQKINTLKKYGSTSTISSASSIGSTNTILFTNSINSYKTVDTTFDEKTYLNNEHSDLSIKNKLENIKKMNQQTVIIAKNKFQQANQKLEEVKALTDKFKANFTPSVKKPNVNTPIKTPFKTPLKTPIKLNTDFKINSAQSTIISSSILKKPNDDHRTPSKSLELKINREDYGINDLRSEDETDDEDQPNKPIPEWAKDTNILKSSLKQARGCIHFTNLFKAATRTEINLEQIFKVKKQKYYQRSSSANWKSPPVWKTNGLNGDESFKKINIY